MLTNNVVSFYVSAQNDSVSHIMWGSWDVKKTIGNPLHARARNGVKAW